MVLRTSKKDGFTLIELLVVMAIILILAGLLTPGLFKAKTQAGKVSCANNMKQIGTAMELYAGKHSDTYPGALAELSTDNDIDDTNVLNCPAAGTSYSAFSVVPTSGTASNTIILSCTNAAHGTGASVSLYKGGYVKIR